MSKPIAYFDKAIGWNDDGKVEKGMRALLGDVTGHPRLGTERVVTTSTVLNIKRDKSGNVTEIETLNTIYRKREVTE